MLHAEHEMNCSTAAVRHLASSGVDVYTAVAGAVGALYGPLHGGANEAVLKMLARIGTVRMLGSHACKYGAALSGLAVLRTILAAHHEHMQIYQIFC